MEFKHEITLHKASTCSVEDNDKSVFNTAFYYGLVNNDVCVFKIQNKNQQILCTLNILMLDVNSRMLCCISA